MTARGAGSLRRGGQGRERDGRGGGEGLALCNQMRATCAALLEEAGEPDGVAGEDVGLAEGDRVVLDVPPAGPSGFEVCRRLEPIRRPAASRWSTIDVAHLRCEVAAAGTS